MQLMADALGGTVERTNIAEYGGVELERTDTDSSLLATLAQLEPVWMSHRDAVTSPPAGARITARTEHTPIAAFEHHERRWFGVQFHPEVVHTPSGAGILERFLGVIANAPRTWDASHVIAEIVEDIRSQVGEAGHVMCALSGGVDSSVAAALVHRAIGDRLTCVFVDHGLLRQGEAEHVVHAMSGRFSTQFVHVDAHKRFLEQLEGVSYPERKRAIIGSEFIRVFEDEAAKLVATHETGTVEYLVQGTLYSDVIESGGSDDESESNTIKSHHNVGGLPADLGFQLIEPLRLLFKDEVRRVGEALNLPHELVWRQPFPGPGLAIRIIGEVTPDHLETVRRADAILHDELVAADLANDVWQYFAVLLADVRSVGVQGDSRTYAHPIVLRAVTSDDAMTADWARIDHATLARISQRIVGEIPTVNRVVLDITSKPPGTIEWE
jgi:GMP synthase (glutamine-hydrolysing)